MKKIAILVLIAIACVFITSCVLDSVGYCPYCGKRRISEVSEGVYKCDNSKCGKTFGARELD